MNTAVYNKSNKCCLLVFRNKKINDFSGADTVISEFANGGYYFDKISYVAFNCSTEIVFALKDGLENYENIVIYCPKAMEGTIKDFAVAAVGGEFDGLNFLKSDGNLVFILFSDSNNRLLVSDICNELDKRYGVNHGCAYVKTVGAPQNLIMSAVNSAKSICGELEFNISESYGDAKIEVVYGSNTPKSIFDRALRELVTRLDKYIYALEDISLEERLVQLLKLRRMKIAVAESFTGGGICKRLVSISGVSEVFYEGLNTYSNEAKAARLGVDEMTLKRFGAVSEQTAAEMAEGLIKDGNCDVSISTTGIAGPKSDNTNKPVGLTYIGIALKDGTQAFKYQLCGSRKNITETAINLALFLAYKFIK